MKITQVRYVKSALKPEQFPVHDLPEFAFLGRSNVGKSSLINMISGHKSLVKTGSKPGVTTMINFFLFNENISIVDLPGFGYAAVPVSLKKTFAPMIMKYLTERPNLRLAFLLIDIRRTPGDFEEQMLSLLSRNKTPVAILLTKCDKLGREQRKIQVEKIRASLGLPSDALFLTSASRGEGKREVLKLIRDFSFAGGLRAESSDT